MVPFPDYDIAGGTITPEQVLNNWESIIGNATVIDTGFIVLEHDLFQQSVDIATGYILPDALAHQPPFKIEPIISCLGKPMQDAYIETNDNSSNPIGTFDTARLIQSDRMLIVLDHSYQVAAMARAALPPRVPLAARVPLLATAARTVR